MRSARLVGRDHEQLGAVAAVAEGPVAITLSRGGAAKTYSYAEPNEDAVLFATGEGGTLLAVADGHDGATGSQSVIEFLEESVAPLWTARHVSDGATDWQERALDVLLRCNATVLENAGVQEMPPSPTTLSVALARPGEDLLLHASAGDSHVFRAGADDTVVDRGWASLGRDRTYFLGYGTMTQLGQQKRSIVGVESLAGVRALVLATDGLSEQGIGVKSPEASVSEALAQAAMGDAELRSMAACKTITRVALAAHREHSAGDNIACAVLWLEQS